MYFWKFNFDIDIVTREKLSSYDHFLKWRIILKLDINKHYNTSYL